MKKIIISVFMTFICLTTFPIFQPKLIQSATIYQTDVSQPATGNVFIRVDGVFSTHSSKSLVDRINQIRLEACKQGLINPDTGKKLTTADYKPVQWSSTLEEYARVRAVEASVNWSHTRPNGKSTFKTKMAKVTNGYHSGENLALGYSLFDSINGYYQEKSNWIKQSGAYGHYSNMISPENTLVGMVAFQQQGKPIFSSMEFGTLFLENGKKDSTKQISYSGNASHVVEVNTGLLINSITISGSNSVFEGAKIKLNAIANMKNATKTAVIIKGQSWKSSDTSIATIDANGNITAKKPGTVTITLTIPGKSASFKLTVNKKPDVKVLLVKIKEVTKAIIANNSYTLSTVVEPANATNKSLSFSSSNSKVATVDANGKVTAKSAGTTVITAKAKDGSGAKATTTITVKNPVKISSIKLKESSKSIYVSDFFTINAIISPSNATNKKLTYKSSNTKVATVDKNGKVVAKNVGTATITVSTNDGSNKTARIKLTVKAPIKVKSIKLNRSSLIMNRGASYKLTAIFNPTNATNKNVTWKSSNNKIATVDSNGKVVAKSPGAVSIIATSKDGNKTAICKITIKK